MLAEPKIKFSHGEQELLRAYGFYQKELDGSPTSAIVERIGKICEKLRVLGLAGDWTYSLPDHRALFRLYKRHRV